MTVPKKSITLYSEKEKDFSYSVDNELIDPHEIMKENSWGLFMGRISFKDWEGVIENAIKSGQKINECCADLGIDKTTFYRHCRKLGFIKNGKRTGKWTAHSSDRKKAAPNPEPVLVPVPRETICAASNPVPESAADGRPSICIQNGSLKIFVGDGFRRETLLDVLEVVRIAQGS